MAVKSNFQDFARRIRLRGRQVEERSGKLLRETALRILTQVVQSTPVDTGRARGNWQVTVDSPVSSEITRLDKVGGSTVASGQANMASARSGNTIYISNNVPYIGRLNEGSSSQAPAGFVELAIRTAIAGVRGARLVGP